MKTGSVIYIAISHDAFMINHCDKVSLEFPIEPGDIENDCAANE